MGWKLSPNNTNEPTQFYTTYIESGAFKAFVVCVCILTHFFINKQMKPLIQLILSSIHTTDGILLLSKVNEYAKSLEKPRFLSINEENVVLFQVVNMDQYKAGRAQRNAKREQLSVLRLTVFSSCGSHSIPFGESLSIVFTILPLKSHNGQGQPSYSEQNAERGQAV